MCGRFTLHSRLNLLLHQFAVETAPHWKPRYNIAPTQTALVVRQIESQPRQMVGLRWGLVPSWAKDASIGNQMINARAETVASKPAFRTAFKRRRCVVPADGYYEWAKTQQGKQPYYIRLRDEAPFGMAGLWDSWHTDREDAMETFTIITTDSAECTQPLHDRMPVILRPEDYDLWLDPTFQASAPLQALLRPYDSDEIRFDPVSTLVNSPRNDEATCIEPMNLEK